MKLLEPYFLYAFVALAIPILIHLFSLQKHKIVYFSNVAFLRQLQQKKSNITTLQKLLLLLLRLLLISAIILAFCEPYINTKDTLIKNKQIVGIYIDNSFSMNASNDKGLLIEQAKNNARSVLSAHQGKDAFIFMSNELQGKYQRIIDYNDCLEAIDALEITPSLLSINAVINRFSSLKQNEPITEAALYLISDFQKSTSPTDFPTKNPHISTHLLPISAYPQTNLAVDTCYLDNPIHIIGHQESLTFEVSNTSNEPVENLSVKLFINGTQKALTTLNIDAKSKTKAQLSFNNHKTGTQQAYLELKDATITFDNRLYFNFNVDEKTPVLSIYEQEANRSLTSLFSESIFDFQNLPVNNIDFNEFGKYNLIILEDITKPTSGLINALKQYTIEGGNLLIIPSKNLNLASFSQFSEALNVPKFTKLNTKKVKVSEINVKHTLFKDVFEKQTKHSVYPEVNHYYSLANTYTNTAEEVMVLNTSELFLGSYKNGLGSVYIQTSPLNTTSNTFEKHALFVPIYYNMASLSSKEEKLYYTLGTDRILNTRGGNASASWELKKGTHINLIPEVRNLKQQFQINLQNNLNEDGFYSLNNGDLNKILSFNFDRKESNLSTRELEDLEKLSETYSHINLWKKEGLQLEKALKENRNGTPLWHIFILLALVFISIESLLQKNWAAKPKTHQEN